MNIASELPMTATLALNRADLLRTQNFIDGKWRDARTSLCFEVADPASGAVFAHAPDSSADDARDATDAAHAAFDGWRA